MIILKMIKLIKKIIGVFSSIHSCLLRLRDVHTEIEERIIRLDFKIIFIILLINLINNFNQ